MNPLIHEAAERLDTLITILELGAIDQSETAEVLRKSKITLERLRNEDGDRLVQDVHIVNGYGERRTLVSAKWAGDTLFFFDMSGLSYQKYGEVADESETFEQISSGDRWTRVR
jgi:hypothetical protein